MNTTVEQLWNWAESRSGGDPETTWELLNSLGLAPPARSPDYWCSPVNVTTFACTGMDGAHYALIETDEEIQPVVLVAPNSRQCPHVIVGESLHEFLALGCQQGYGPLMELAHRPLYIVRLLEGANPCVCPTDEDLLSSLRRRFQLRPWAKVGERLFELQELYLDTLDIPD